jgi:hypothetical protein
MPNAVPTAVPRAIAGRQVSRSLRVGISPVTAPDTRPRFAPCSMLYMISASPKMPIEIGTNPKPSKRVSIPIVMR